MNHSKKIISCVSAAVLGFSMLLPFQASALYTIGDVNEDGKVNAKDAAFILVEAAKRGTGKPTQDTAMEVAADVNNDHAINAKDANEILRYAALIGAGKTNKQFSEYMKDQSSAPDVYKQELDTVSVFKLDLSKQGNYDFNGEMMVLTFQVNANTPAGSYPIRVVSTDFASWEEVAYKPAVIDGEVNVGGTPAAQAALSDKDFSLKVNSVTAAAGETVQVKVDIANNPGFCGFITKIQYDKGAMTLVSTTSGKDFGDMIEVS